MGLCQTSLALVGFSLLLIAPGAIAQTTTGTLFGRVVDTQGLPSLVALFRVESPRLQGTRVVMTSASGDYLVALLPPGNIV